MNKRPCERTPGKTGFRSVCSATASVDPPHPLLQPVLYGKVALETTSQISERNPWPPRGQPEIDGGLAYTIEEDLFNAIYLKCFQKV